MKFINKNHLLIIAGTLFVILGFLGIFLPVLPTTPFLLLAAACYFRSSDRFYRWLMNNRILGTYISNYLEGRGMSMRSKVITLLLLWLTIGLTIILGIQNIIIRIILVIIAVGVTIHIGRLKTRKQ
ncbi:MAG: YbaN family protein [Dehalococcoidales bacterium]|nr:MAG: YbaN family protein [Dehalococcoidales bacterium]